MQLETQHGGDNLLHTLSIKHDVELNAKHAWYKFRIVSSTAQQNYFIHCKDLAIRFRAECSLEIYLVEAKEEESH